MPLSLLMVLILQSNWVEIIVANLGNRDWVSDLWLSK